MEQIPILKIGDCLLVSIQVDMHDRLAMALQDDLTNRIVATRARGVMIDISALEIVDSFIGRMISNISGMARILDADTVIVGNIRRRGHFIVSGEIHGDGELEGALHLAVTANWHGTVHADQAIVAGKITGGLIVKDKLEIGYTAVIRGRVSARTIAIAKGAIVDGQIEVTSDAPVVEFEEKREGR